MQALQSFVQRLMDKHTSLVPHTGGPPAAHGASHAPGGTDDLYSGFGHRLSTVVEPFPAWAFSGNAALTSGTVYFQFWTADITPALARMLYDSRGVASSGLTLARLGIYSVSGNTLTLVARTASDTTIGNTVNAESSVVFDTTGGFPSTLTPTRGTLYALAVILVGTTPGNAPVCGQGATATMASRGPLCRTLAGQSDLPTSTALTSLAQNASPFYIAAST